MNQKNKSAFDETWKILIGEAVTISIMALVFLIFNALTINVFFGALLGAATNIISFLVLCFSIEKIIQDNDKSKGMKTQRFSYIVRLAVMALGLVIGLKFSIFNNIAVIVPLLVTRPTLTIFAVLENKGGKKDDN